MPSYLALLNWTEQGIKSVKESPNRLEDAKQRVQQAGGRMIFFYMLMGEYDMAALVELPDDDAAAKFMLTLAGQGAIRSRTMRAFTEDEYRGIVGSLQ